MAFTTGLNSHSCEVHDTSASDSALPSPHSETQAENHRWSLWQKKREYAEPVLVALEWQRSLMAKLKFKGSGEAQSYHVLGRRIAWNTWWLALRTSTDNGQPSRPAMEADSSRLWTRRSTSSWERSSILEPEKLWVSLPSGLGSQD